MGLVESSSAKRPISPVRGDLLEPRLWIVLLPTHEDGVGIVGGSLLLLRVRADVEVALS